MTIDKQNTIISTFTWEQQIDAKDIFHKMDQLYNLGFRKLECSASYPLNSGAEYFRRTESIIQQWIEGSGVSDLELFLRIGNVDNNYPGKDFNYSRSFILMLGDDYIHKFGKNLKCFIISEDNRNDPEEINETVLALQYFAEKSILSGISVSPGYKYYLEAFQRAEMHPYLFINPDQEQDINQIRAIDTAGIFLDFPMAMEMLHSTSFDNEQNFMTTAHSILDNFKKENQFSEIPGMVLPIKDITLTE